MTPAPGPPGPAAGGRPGRLTAALFAGGIATFAELYAVQAVLPGLAAEFGLTESQATLAVSVATGALALSVLPWAAWGDRVGRARAMRMALTGEKVDATTAERWGLVSELVAHKDFDARAAALLEELAGRGPLSAAATRQAINAATLDLDGALTREEVGQSRLLGTSDFAEGVTAFREKRSARFSGA